MPTSSTAARKVCGNPMASMMTSGPNPLVRSRRRWCSDSLLVLMVSAAPVFLARFNLSSSTSMPIVRAPRKPDAAIAPSPTPPQPKTATESWAVTRPRATAWKPTVKGSTRQSSLIVRLAGIKFVFRHADVLSQRSISLHSESFIELAGVGSLAQAGSALAAVGVRRHGDIDPRSQSRIILAARNDGRGDFVPGMRGNVTIGFFPRKEFRSLPQSPIMRTLSRRFSPELTGSVIDSTTASPGFFMTTAFI